MVPVMEKCITMTLQVMMFLTTLSEDSTLTENSTGMIILMSVATNTQITVVYGQIIS